MIRRLAVLIFIAAASSQAFAGLCFCEETLAVPSCCKRKADANNYLTRKSCCDDGNCSVQRSNAPAAALSEAAVVASHDAATVPNLPNFIAPELYSAGPDRISFAAGRCKYRPRAPELYVRHHAFLI